MNDSVTEMLKLFANSRSSISISRGNGTYVSSRGNVSISIGDSNFTVSGNTLQLGNSIYDLNNPNETARIQPDHKEIFWSFCTDNAKNSDEYRTYAHSILNSVNIDVESISSPHMKLLIINQATSVSKLGDYLAKRGSIEWLDDISKLPVEQFELIINKSTDVKKLLEQLNELGDHSEFTTLINLDPNYLKILLHNIFNATDFMSTLGKMGYKNPLSRLLSINIPTLENLLENKYDTLEIIKGLLKIGYNADPLTNLVTIPADRLSQLLKNRYDALEILKALYKFNYSDPLAIMLSIEMNTLQYLFNNRYDSIELMTAFSKLRYNNPLQTLITLDNATLSLFVKNRYDTIEVLNALYKSGKSDPIKFLLALGKDAIITILGSRYEYVNRINRGVNLTHEFHPAPIIIADNEFRNELKNFIEVASKREYSNKELLDKVDITSDLIEDFKDSLTSQVVNIPVRLDGELFDLNTLINLKQDSCGYRKNPLNNDQFLLSSLQSAKDIQKRIDKIIETTPVSENHFKFK